MDVEKLKGYLRVDGDSDDTLIESLQVAAEEYMSNAGIEKDYEKKLYTLAIRLLVSHWYDNRSIQESGKVIGKLAFSMDAIIMQLKYGVVRNV